MKKKKTPTIHAHQRHVARACNVSVPELLGLATHSRFLERQLVDPDFGAARGELDLEAIEAVLDQENG